MAKKQQGLVVAAAEGDEQKEIALKKVEAEEILAEFKDFNIENDEDYEIVAEGLKEVKRIIKEIEARRKKVTEPLNKALSEFRSWYTPALKVLESTEQILKQRMLGYSAEKARRSELAMLQVAAAAKAGNFDAAHEASKEIVSAPVVAGISQIAYWEYSVVDPSIVPRKFLEVSDSAIKEYVKKAGPEGPEDVPGLRFEKKQRMAAKT